MSLETMANRVAAYTVAKERPTTLFQATFFDLRLEVKDIKSKMAKEALGKLEAALTKDLKDRGFLGASVALKLGKYRGSAFITSGIVEVKVKSEKDARKLEAHLRETYDPKYVLKGVQDSIARYNIR